MTYSIPPVVKLAERLLLEIDAAVRGFPRFHKYVVGADIRAQAMIVARMANRAWRDRSRQAEWIAQLVWAVDEMKIVMQLGSQVRAFASLAQFEDLMRTARDLGKQVGGWHRQQHPKGQNETAKAPLQRPQILSTQAASYEANL